MNTVLNVLKVTGKAVGTVTAKFIIWLAEKLEGGEISHGKRGINVLRQGEALAWSWHNGGGSP